MVYPICVVEFFLNVNGNPFGARLHMTARWIQVNHAAVCR